MPGSEIRTSARGAVLVDTVRESPVDAHLTRQRRRALVVVLAALAVVILALVVRSG